MSDKIYCGKEGSFSASGALFKPGQALTRKALSSISSKRMKRLLNDGTLVSGTVSTVFKDSEATIVHPDPEPAPKLETVKKWNLHPASLVGKELHQLNIMVLERDPTMPPFETIEEVGAQLTRDWKGKL